MSEENKEKNEEINIKDSKKDKITIEIKKHSLIKSLVVVIILFAVVFFAYNYFFVEKRTAKTVVTSILQDQKVISELSTLVVPYGGIYEEQNESEAIKYIAYSGTVTYGIDFSEVEPLINEDEKSIIIKIPEISLVNVYVEPSSLSSIPEGKPDELATRLYKCENDLRSKFGNKDDEMSTFAYESAKETLTNFFKPIIKELGDEYKIIIEQGEANV